MKHILVVIAVLVCADIAAHFVPSVHAQSAGVPLQLTVSAATHIACSPVVAATTFCAAADGLWQSINGAAFTQVGAVAPTGVTSFNGRTGDVVSAANDYSYAQLSKPPTNLSGCNASVSTSGTTAGTSGSLSAQGCVIK